MPAAAMPSAPSSRQYQPKDENCYFGDGREDHLLEYVQSQCRSRTQVQVDDVLALIDEFGVAQKYMMNVGAEKGQIVTSLIAEHKPQVMIELGGYVGYSTLLFGDALRRNGGRRFISFERDARFAKIAQAFVELAGLSDVVQFVVGSSSNNLIAERAAGRLDKVDMIFLDHTKPAYIRDLKICESLGIIERGVVLVADNMIFPGNPPYLEYVRATPEEKQRQFSSQKSSNGEQFPLQTAIQYEGVDESEDAELPGVPGIVYDSRMIHSYEPTGQPDGVEVTVCKSVPAR